MPQTVVVTGANSGIGLAFAKLLADKAWTVYAVDLSIGARLKSANVKTFEMDVASPESIAAFGDFFGDQPLDLLLNIAGIMAPKSKDALSSIDFETLSKTFSVNTFGPLLLTKQLLPNLLKSPSPKIGNMSSRVGSIADNSSGGSYAYRSSKTALNSISKNLAVELKDKGVTVVIMHPGFVKTNLDRDNWTLSEAVESSEAAGKLYKVLVDKGITDTGKFWHREGYELEW